jgi:hypothetical protein
MRRLPLPLIVLAVILAVASAAVLAGRGDRDGIVAQEATVVPTEFVDPNFHPEAGEDPSTNPPVPGIPAIPPRADAPIGGPAFTAADVNAYLATRPPAYAVGPAVVNRVEFLPAQQVEAKLGTMSNRPPEHLLCLVTLTGDFGTIAGVKLTTGYLVFDARTGNLLIEGVPE